MDLGGADTLERPPQPDQRAPSIDDDSRLAWIIRMVLRVTGERNGDGDDGDLEDPVEIDIESGGFEIDDADEESPVGIDWKRRWTRC